MPLTAKEPASNRSPHSQWQRALQGVTQLGLVSGRIGPLFKTALHTLVLFTGRYTVPGPYTYKRFWYRDATFSIYALLQMGLLKQAGKALALFPKFQQSDGYFRSQTGEWDSNGQALWLFYQYQRYSQKPLPSEWLKAVKKGALWLQRQLQQPHYPSPHAGLLPAGFSAEHLGPIDYFYWDNFWALAGLQAVQTLLPHNAQLDACQQQLEAALNQSLKHVAERLGQPALPASP